MNNWHKYYEEPICMPPHPTAWRKIDIEDALRAGRIDPIKGLEALDTLKRALPERFYIIAPRFEYARDFMRVVNRPRAQYVDRPECLMGARSPMVLLLETHEEFPEVLGRQLQSVLKGRRDPDVWHIAHWRF